jgi:hypothetical protein
MLSILYIYLQNINKRLDQIEEKMSRILPMEEKLDKVLSNSESQSGRSPGNGVSEGTCLTKETKLKSDRSDFKFQTEKCRQWIPGKTVFYNVLQA